MSRIHLKEWPTFKPNVAKTQKLLFTKSAGLYAIYLNVPAILAADSEVAIRVKYGLLVLEHFWKCGTFMFQVKFMLFCRYFVTDYII